MVIVSAINLVSAIESIVYKIIIDHFSLNALFKSLHNRALPYLEIKEAMTRISGRLPADLEFGINRELIIYQKRMGSILARFPHQKIQRLLDQTASNLSPSERQLFYHNTNNLYELCKKYSEDLRGLKKNIVKHILFEFIKVERCFQMGIFERNVFHILQKIPLEEVLTTIISHRNIEIKNILVISLLEILQKKDGEMIIELDDELQQLTQLKYTTKTALMARQVLITAHQPSYEKRHNQEMLY